MGVPLCHASDKYSLNYEEEQQPTFHYKNKINQQYREQIRYLSTYWLFHVLEVIPVVGKI